MKVPNVSAMRRESKEWGDGASAIFVQSEELLGTPPRYPRGPLPTTAPPPKRNRAVVTTTLGQEHPRPTEGTQRLTRTMNARILVVDDDPAIAEMIGIVLRAEGFEPQFAGEGQAALDLFRSGKADLVLLDLMLPGMDGIEVCAHIRAESGVPIIMLTAKGDAADVVRGLESGADDYVVKPFNPKELVARIRARLRPTLPTSSDAIGIGDLVIDVAGHEVRRGESRINLTPLEFELLLALAAKPQQVFTREMLLEQVWGYHYKADTRLVNVHVQRLRAKVEHDPDNPRIVTTVRGVGYRAGAVT